MSPTCSDSELYSYYATFFVYFHRLTLIDDTHCSRCRRPTLRVPCGGVAVPASSSALDGKRHDSPINLVQAIR